MAVTIFQFENGGWRGEGWNGPNQLCRLTRQKSGGVLTQAKLTRLCKKSLRRRLAAHRTILSVGFKSVSLVRSEH